MANQSRRDFLRKTAYIAPAILALKVAPAFAKKGSLHCDNGFGTGSDCSPPGLVDNPNANHNGQDD